MGEKDYWFISYSTKDTPIVNALVEILQCCGISYWKAPEMIPAGSNYAKEIPKAISGCSIFLFVISEASQNSIWVEKEVDMAIGYRKKIVPLKIDMTMLNDMYHFYLNNVQTIQVDVQDNGELSSEMKETLKLLFLQDSGKNTNFLKNTETFEGAKKSIKVDTRSNALRVNKIPLQCEYCGEPLPPGEMGIYTCTRCGREHYDEFKKIRNFLEQHGPASALDISRGTGVSVPTIREYFSDKYTKRSVVSQNQVSKQKDVWHFRRGEDSLGYRKR